jgi:hypothetical protein
MDFWMRYPDYLANELLDMFEIDGTPEFLETAKQIFEDREPDLRHVPMPRYLFGAFEPLDNALSILRAVDLIRIRRRGQPGHVQQHLYLLTQRGREAISQLAVAAVELAWYRDRAELVAKIAGGTGGTALKDRQYLQKEYAETDLSKPIRPITDRVRVRLNLLLGMEGT